MVQLMDTPTNHVFVAPTYLLTGASGTWGISQHLSAKYKWKPKKVLPLERGAPRIVPYGKSVPGCYTTFIKTLNESLR